jgi:hypothetical protein
MAMRPMTRDNGCDGSLRLRPFRNNKGYVGVLLKESMCPNLENLSPLAASPRILTMAQGMEAGQVARSIGGV